jgi:hypothetical protein
MQRELESGLSPPFDISVAPKPGFKEDLHYALYGMARFEDI